MVSNKRLEQSKDSYVICTNSIAARNGAEQGGVTDDHGPRSTVKNFHRIVSYHLDYVGPTLTKT